MARPKKDANIPDARQRLADSFWQLLEDNRLNEITVGVLTAKAGCNRGTFYYHYEDIEDLITYAIEEEVFKNNIIPNTIFNILTHTNQQMIGQIFGPNERRRLERLQLLIDKGGMDTVDVKVKEAIISMWEAILAPNGTGLNQETRLILEYTIGGTISLITYASRFSMKLDDILNSNMVLREFFPWTLSKICKAQGASEEEVLSRLSSIDRFMDLSQG